ncbi:transcription factor grauzone-like [Culex quinquefasciatus]|uniref:transcription factor grauzone-like n=1 Tax=Culex quinquefasciatus TaxID=7176 RepID=UPI0018E2AD70|nr:transcription factor grauzone-like [Culex quinquefasciatus]
MALRMVHTLNVKITRCYKSHAVLYVHIRNYHTEPRFVCDICAKPFRIMSEFKKHKLSHEDPDKLKMQCPHCMKWYKTREYWRAHIRLTHRSKQNQMIKCEKCEKTFSRKDKMRAHMKHVHDEPTKKCEYCEKCFVKDISLREHVASQHTGEVLYTCTYCPKTFNSNANMFSHRRKMHPVEWLAAKERSKRPGNGLIWWRTLPQSRRTEPACKMTIEMGHIGKAS